ncbi:hypothetical protein [Actinocrispum wychmicini]|uniref:Uncharacterized protein n=1 Tax=Actinocrispum wychmicini TaxID=1213861 RepID=A0A4R2JAA9_9PSEU|nr:hypothetical protein [Actinocrispum wychmicini]TCO53636.1 hypothetical protein EV192_110225 [Actinocrispum wychmicini]
MLLKVVGGIAGVAVAVVAFSLISKGCASYLADEGKTVQAYFRAVGSGDTAKACGLLADGAVAKLQEQQQAPSCEVAVRSLYTALNQNERDALVKQDISVNESRATTRRKEITIVSSNPLGLYDFALKDRDGREVIIDWGLDAMQISST